VAEKELMVTETLPIFFSRGSFVALFFKNDHGVNFMYWFFIQGMVRGSKELN
jgi:hypothetical protein